MSAYLSSFLAVGMIQVLGLMSPGPDFFSVVKMTLQNSRTAGYWTALGLGLGVCVHAGYSLLGIAVVIAGNPFLYSFIRYTGSLYLIYLGLSCLKPGGKKALVSVEETSSLNPSRAFWVDWKALRTGFFTNVLNPKATLFLLSIFTQVINPETPFYIQLMYAFELVSLSWIWFFFVAYAISSSKIKAFLERHQSKAIKGMGIVMIALGLKVALF